MVNVHSDAASRTSDDLRRADGLRRVCAQAEILAAQDQWVQIMPSFPGGALIDGGIILFAGWIMNEGRELRDECRCPAAQAT